MAKVPLQNVSPWSYRKTVEEASSAVSKWPEWKRERQLFSPESERKNPNRTETKEEDLKSR
jgi:hypothetical protein